jgi:hypothetical protein
MGNNEVLIWITFVLGFGFSVMACIADSYKDELAEEQKQSDKLRERLKIALSQLKEYENGK